MASFIQEVVSQLEFLEGHCLASQLLTGHGGVVVLVEARGQRRVSLAGHQPRRPMVGVAVAFVVHSNHVHQYEVATVRLQAAEGNPQCWKHASAKTRKYRLTLCVCLCLICY